MATASLNKGSHGLATLKASSRRLVSACDLPDGTASGKRLGRRGSQSHRLIAEHYLDPAGRSKGDTARWRHDTHPLTAHDIASEATWADKYRDSDRDTTKIPTRGRGDGTLWTSNSRSPISPQPVSAIRRFLLVSRLRKVRRKPASSTRSINSRPSSAIGPPVLRSSSRH